MFAMRKRPFLSTVISRISTFRKGLNNIITPLLCLEPYANRISSPHSARHTSSKLASLQVSCKKIISNLFRWSHRKSFRRLIDLLRPLIFSETSLRHVCFWYLQAFIFGIICVPHCANHDSVSSRKSCRLVFWRMQVTMHKGEKQLQNKRQNIKSEIL